MCGSCCLCTYLLHPKMLLTTVDQAQTELCEKGVPGNLLRLDLDVATLNSLIVRWEELVVTHFLPLVQNQTLRKK